MVVLGIHVLVVRLNSSQNTHTSSDETGFSLLKQRAATLTLNILCIHYMHQFGSHRS